MTVASGVIFVPPLVSLMVAMHVVTWFSKTSTELQVIVVDVDLATAERL